MKTENGTRRGGMKTSIKRFGLATAMVAMAALSTPVFAQQADSASILIYDASGSMWGQLDGGITKVEVAREVIGDFFVSRDNSVPLGVIAYGHNRRGDCTDIEVIANVGVNDPAGLSSSLNRLNPRGMTPITDSLSLAASMIPPTAESADIILVTDGLETCEADPCALAAQLAQEGIAIRAHVVGFGLTSQEAEAMACVADATGGLLLTPQTGQELADALNQVSQLAPAPAPEPQPEPVAEAFFDIGPSAEAGHDYRISFAGSARNVDYAGFTRRGEGQPDVSPSYGVLGGAEVGNNPFTRRAPLEPGEYDLILAVTGQGIIARQPIEVVPPSNGFDAIGSVQPDTRFEFTWRGPNQVGQRIVVARPGAAPNDYFESWGYPYNNRQTQRMGLKAPAEPGIYELRYISGNQREVLFFREFGVGVSYEDADLTGTAELAARAAALTQAAPGQDAMPMVRATFRIPDGYSQTPLSWDAIPLDPDMSPEAYAPISETFVWDNEFEPGRYRVSAMGPGESEFSAEVEIYPGQDNNFVIPVVGGEENRDEVLAISGDWRVLAVAPRDAPPGSPDYPMVMAHVALMVNMAGTAYQGLISPTEQMVGPGGAANGVALDSVTEEEGYLFIRFNVPALSHEPFVLSLQPFDDGYAGTMDSAPNSLPVVFWPATHGYPSMAEMQDVLYGPEADLARSEEFDPVVFTCDQPSCVWTDPRSGLRAELPQGWGVTEPVFFAAVGDNLPIENPRMTFSGPGGAELRLNPHQWLSSNGPCIGTADLGGLCHWADADGPTRIAASFIAQGLQRGNPVATASTDACGEDVCFVRNEQFGIEAQLPRGWRMWQLERVDGALRAQFTNGDSVLMLIPADNWNPENGPCFDSTAGPVCYWAEGDPAARLAAPFIAANLAVDPAREQGSAAEERAVSFTLDGDPSDAFVALEVRFETGSYPSGVLPGDVLYTMDGGLASLTGPFKIGNSYSFKATVEGRDYAARNIPIEFGSGPQSINLRPLFAHGDVKLQLPSDPIIAGSGGYFPITFEAPADFAGSIALHDASDRERAPLFEEDGQWLLEVQDQVLPVPDVPGLYEVRFLDADGQMFGGVEFEALAQSSGSTSASGTIRVTFRPAEQFGTGCFLNAELSNPSGESFTLVAPINATANGQQVRPVLNPDEPVMLEIDAYTDTGAALTPPMLMSPCETLVIGLGPVQCRMGVGSSEPLSACPLPVEAVAIPEFTDLFVVGASDQPPSPTPSTPSAASASSDGIIPVDLGGRDPDAVLRALFNNQSGN
ncbi:vWA domain-containing protein [Brucella anthropi]|uniref:vWA domain-containing protein n=1 Tax=Brucella anthropi TaxID=529 RepID=UPI00244C12BD|nr:hypothetical protein [Brucella anthropi]MDH0367897.1 hypothetical protein [Brucella anthropi]